MKAFSLSTAYCRVSLWKCKVLIGMSTLFCCLICVSYAGGGRSGGLNRKNSGGTQTYRRVQLSTSASETASDDDGVIRHVNGASHAGNSRKVEVVKKQPEADSPPPAPFKSSLLASMSNNQPAASKYSKSGGYQPQEERRGGGRGGPRHGGDKPKFPYGGSASRERSSSPHKRGEQHQANTERGRVVTLSSSMGAHSPKKQHPSVRKQDSPRKEYRARNGSHLHDEDDDDNEPPRRFVSSLVGSIGANKNKDNGVRLSDQKTQDRGDQGGSSRSAGNSREVRYTQREDPHHRDLPSHRKVEVQQSSESSYRRLSEKNLRSLSRPVSRKNSVESVTSLRSERSERSDYGGSSRWGDRGKRDHCHHGGSSNRYDDEYSRRSLGNAGRYSGNAEEIPPAGRVTRSVSDINRSSAPAGTTHQPPVATSVTATARSSQDVRFQNSSSSVSAAAASTRATQEPPARGRQISDNASGVRPFRSSLESSLSRSVAHGAMQSSTPSQSRSSSLARSVVSDVDSSRESVHKSPGVGSRKVPGSPRAFTSSLSNAIAEGEQRERASSNPKQNEPPAIDEAERKRLATEAIRERFAVRRAERELATSLQRAASSTNVASSPQTETKREFKSGLAGSIGVGIGDAAAEKTKRTEEFFNKLKAEDTAKEDARRAIGFKSSLLSSMSVAPTPAATPSRMAKTVYSLSDLRRLMPVSTPKPKDLPNMTIVDVTEVRPKTRALGSASGSSGRLVSHTSDRSLGRFGKKQSERSVRNAAGIQRQASFAGGAKKDRQQQQRRGGGRGGGGRNAPPPPPLYDGPIEPLTVSENRWVPKKDKSVRESTLSYVKGLLNKLTREKFAKITSDVCAIEMDNMELLRNVVSVIMDKALEEPSFADVYADLCKEFHALPLSSMTFHHHGKYIVAVAEVSRGEFFYTKRKIDELSEDEPVIGAFASAAGQQRAKFSPFVRVFNLMSSADAAMTAAQSLTSFKRLLVTRCQVEFEKTNKRTTTGKDTAPQDGDGNEVDERQKEINAMRAKRLMLGNIRFIGELFKVDMLKLIPGHDGQEFAAQTIRFPDEEDMEALCKMLATAGKKFDQPKTKTIMNIIILRLVELSDDTKLPSRARFLIKDLLEMRDHMWEPRRAELQQKTLDEVRREAQKLQQQGKNAQHDNLSQRRQKTRITSAQLAKQSSSLLVHREIPVESSSTSPDATQEEEAVEEEHAAEAEAEEDVAKYASRIKNIIQEYTSIVDIEEAAACVRELPDGAVHVEFAEQAINLALDGKTSERDHAVTLLVGLYERVALNAMEIQQALVNVAEFLEDLHIDIPHVHEYIGLVFGRLISVGCFGLSWMLSHPLKDLIECRLASLVFAEVLSVLESETDEKSVKRMLADEEIAAADVLPASVRSNQAETSAFLRKHDLEVFFAEDDDDDDDDDDCVREYDDEDEDDLDPEVAGQMRSTLEEYLTVKDVDEVVLCINECEVNDKTRWMHFVHAATEFSLDSKPAVREAVADLFVQLVERECVTSKDLEDALTMVLGYYEDLRVDIPKIATNLSEVWTLLFQNKTLSVSWLRSATKDLVTSGYASEIVCALFTALSVRMGTAEVREWWSKQSEKDGFWNELVDGEVVANENLLTWKQTLE
ncbi:Eukaryotic translation initiation factor 4 gamma 2, partial [Globisporangium splendens]